MKDSPGMFIKLGSDVHAEGGFKIIIGGVDVTNAMCVKSIHMHAAGDTGPTTVTLECYPESIEIIPSLVNVKILDK